jgi:hypothetical protein
MPYRTTVALPNDVAHAWKRSGLTLVDLIKRGLAHDLALEQRPPNPHQITYTLIKAAIGRPIGAPFTAIELAETLHIAANLAHGRVHLMMQMGMAERLHRSDEPGKPWLYRLTRIPAKRLCDERQCGHPRHLDG